MRVWRTLPPPFFKYKTNKEGANMLDVEVNFDRRMTINVETPAGPREYAMDEVLAIDENDLTEEFKNQAGTYAWWGAILENAKYELDQAELNLEQAEVKADVEVRQKLIDNETKITEALVKRLIPDSHIYVTAVQDVNRRKRDVGILIRVVNAITQRKDMLKSLGMSKDQDYVSSGELRATSRPAEKDGLSVEELKRSVKDNMARK